MVAIEEHDEGNEIKIVERERTVDREVIRYLPRRKGTPQGGAEGGEGSVDVASLREMIRRELRDELQHSEVRPAATATTTTATTLTGSPTVVRTSPLSSTHVGTPLVPPESGTTTTIGRRNPLLSPEGIATLSRPPPRRPPVLTTPRRSSAARPIQPRSAPTQPRPTRSPPSPGLVPFSSRQVSSPVVAAQRRARAEEVLRERAVRLAARREAREREEARERAESAQRARARPKPQSLPRGHGGKRGTVYV